jgi:DNA-binding response OmpR family regulator
MVSLLRVNVRMAKQLLLVDDDALLRRSLAFNLEQAGYHVSTAANAEDAINLARREPPDLILLDIGLPGMDGLDALHHLRDQFDIPVIFLTARRRELDEVLGLELGAEDYITKPFDLDVLLARIKVVLRRVEHQVSPGSGSAPLEVGQLRIDPSARTVLYQGQPVDLSRREFDVLYSLAQEAGRVVSVDDLLARVWGAEFAGQPQAVYVYIRWLREKLEADPQAPCLIQTVRGIGYKLVT